MTFDGSPLLPSAVFAGADGTILTGVDALSAARIDPARFEPSPKRQIDAADVLLGDRQVAVVALLAATLRRVAEEASRVNGGAPVDVMLTHPAGWGPMRRATLRTAAEMAGLNRPDMLAEPVAAATHLLATAGPELPRGLPLAVFDLGGGTFDIALVRDTGTGFEILASDGLADIGGVDLDALVVDLVRQAVQHTDPAGWARLSAPSTVVERRHFRTLWDAARMAKESLSRHSATTIAVPLLDRDVQLTREQFEQAAAPVLGLTVDRTLAVLRRADLGTGRLAGILLVGGATRTPLVGTLLHRATGQPPILLDQPELVVAEGALRTAPVAAAPVAEAASAPIAKDATESPPRQAVQPMRSRGPRGRALAGLVFFALLVSCGLWYAVSHWASLSDQSVTGQIFGIALLVAAFVVMIGDVARVLNPDLLIIDDRGVHLQRIRLGRGLQRLSLPWTQVREAFVAQIELAPNLVVRTHLSPRDGAALTGRGYRPDVAGYALCKLTDVGADPERVRAALSAHTRT